MNSDRLRTTFDAAAELYDRARPGYPQAVFDDLAALADLPLDSAELDRSGRFGPAAFRRYEWDRPYTTDTYLAVLRTYSGHRALAPAARHGLLDCIAHLIDSRYGGRITKRYLTELRAARRVT